MEKKEEREMGVPHQVEVPVVVLTGAQASVSTGCYLFGVVLSWMILHLYPHLCNPPLVVMLVVLLSEAGL